MSTTPTEEQVGTRDGGREIPMVQAAPVVGSMIDFARDTIGAVVGGWQTEGDLFYVKVPMKLAIAVHPDHIKHVLEDHHDDYEPVPWVSAAWNKTVGNGLLASGGHHWARQRRIEQPAFEKDRIARFAETMTAVATESADRWAPAAERGEPIDLKDEMTRLTLEVLARCLFGANWEREAAQIPPAISVCLEYMFAQLKTPVSVPLSVPTPSNRRFLKARQELDDVVHRLIADRRREPGEDIISLMLTSKDSETGESMSDEDIRDEVMALVFAGHETVSVGMTWAWYLLATNPPAQRRLQAEVDEALGGRLPTNDDVPNLPWTWMVLQEALRLYAPVWPIARQPIKDVEISGFHVPKGTMVMILPYLTHRHPDFWENPEGFDPERFSPERSEGRSHFAFIPFGTGPRACLGWPFARLQLRLVTATLAQRYEFRLPPRGKPALPQPGITLRPAEPILAEVVPRGG
jgi:cytochrome P450